MRAIGREATQLLKLTIQSDLDQVRRLARKDQARYLVMVNAPQNGAAGSAPRHMTPCACHRAACRAAGVRHYYYGARGWEKARFDAEIWSVQCWPFPFDSCKLGPAMGASNSSAHK